MEQVELKVFNSGWVPVRKGMVVAGGGRERIFMPAIFAMIRRPGQGVILYDTGYSTRFYEATRWPPYRVLRWFTPAQLQKRDNANNQLSRAGVKPEEVSMIILGHGHVDHVPGVSYFPGAEVVVSGREWEAMQGGAWRLLTKGYVKSLYEGLENRFRFIDFEKEGKPLAGFDAAVDLLGDESLILVPLPGHTSGQMGLLVNSLAGRYFFIGDAAWITENYATLTPPSALARTILASNADFSATLRRILDFHRQNPDVVIVPSHCPRTWERIRPAVGG